MQLDNVPYCYKEYPPIPVMECAGHKQPIRWPLMIPGLVMIAGAVITTILLIIIKK